MRTDKRSVWFFRDSSSRFRYGASPPCLFTDPFQIVDAMITWDFGLHFDCLLTGPVQSLWTITFRHGSACHVGGNETW